MPGTKSPYESVFLSGFETEKRMNTIKGLLTFGALVCFLSACGADQNLHKVGLNAKFIKEDGLAHFVTPAGSVISHSIEDLVGKPYLIATYPAGFSPGNDPAIDQVWGTISEDLDVNFSTDSTYADGAYDIVFVVYVVTELPADVMTTEGSAPAPVQGDLAVFTIDQTAVKEGDPTIMPGVLRINVEGADSFIDVENRTPADPDNSDSFRAAFINTIMMVP